MKTANVLINVNKEINVKKNDIWPSPVSGSHKQIFVKYNIKVYVDVVCSVVYIMLLSGQSCI